MQSKLSFHRAQAWFIFILSFYSYVPFASADELAMRLTLDEDIQTQAVRAPTKMGLASETPINTPPRTVGLFERAGNTANGAITQALDLIGIRYRRGGTSPETGFDCSGFVGHVFREGIGLVLPRSSKDISKSGDVIQKEELQPGDLVFFNTMRRAFSHVGIYLGNNQFIHSPAKGGGVRIEDMNLKYWAKRFNGARRVVNE